MSRRRAALAFAAVLGLAAVLTSQAPGIAAGALLHPSRNRAHAATPAHCEDVEYAGAGVKLTGWRCSGEGQRRGTIVYLHGIADNRASGRGIIDRYRPKGFDVVAYDSRAHGESEGEFCTYGYFEKQDLRRVMDSLAPGPVVLIGTSLGAAVALQGAADDARISGVVAAEVFSDLRTVARDRAPFFLTDRTIAKAFQIAEQRGGVQIDAVSPVEAARRIRSPVLLIHGADDDQTSPAHSQRVLEALRGPKRLILVERAGHNHSLSGADVWGEIDRWIDDDFPGGS
jgi:hypothetical protein